MKKISNLKRICFLTCRGLETPKFIWIGNDNFGNNLSQPTKKQLKNSIERNNRVFTQNPEI